MNLLKCQSKIGIYYKQYIFNGLLMFII